MAFLLSLLLLILYNILKSREDNFGYPYMNNQEKFKAIRKQRKLTLKDLAKIAGSATSISDYENGHTLLSNDVLLELLAYMIVEINEFFQWEDFQNESFLTSIKQAQKALEDKHVLNLKKVQVTFENLYQTKKHYIYHILSLVLTVSIVEIENQEVPQEVLQELSDYFFTLEYWTNLDIGLFGNLVSYFSSQSLSFFTNSILKDLPKELKNNLDRIKLDTLINICYTLLERQEKEASNSLLRHLEERILPYHFAFEKLNLLELEAIYQCLFGETKTALTKHQEILASIGLIFSPAQAEEWDQAFQKIISS